VLDSCNGGPNVQYLQFAQDVSGTTICAENGTPGINFTASVGKQPTGGGAISWVQVLLNNQVITATSAGTSTASAGTGLDNFYPYKFAGGNGTQDSPYEAQDSPYDALFSGDISLERQFTAQMFALWTSSLVSGSIPVPLGYVQWQLDGTATLIGNKWGVSNSSTGTASSFHPAMASDPSYGYPIWATVSTNTTP
jgi:hypothetical protein